MSSEDHTISRTPIDEKAYREGYTAGRRGKGLEVNPYPIASAEAQSWQLGQVTGQRTALRPVGDR
jgi:hypothetical protein